MSDPAARLNTALEGRYRLERELGEGGMAKVYLARRIAEGLWSPDGEWLLIRTGVAGARENTPDVFALRPGVDSVAQPLLAGSYAEREPTISPNGRWMAYVSDESGSNEVFVRPFPDVDAGWWQVSTDGGTMPVWAHNGSELFFMDDSRRMVAAQIDTNSEFRVLELRSLFDLSPGFHASPEITTYSVAPDDQRFLMARAYQGEEAAVSTSVLVQNWFEELKRLVPE